MGRRTGPVTRGAGDLARGLVGRLRRSPWTPGLLSIVVPVYNVEEYLDECLESLRQQTYRDVEILVVDDGSSDASGSIAASQAAEDPRVRVVTRPNGGLSAARNTGVAEARGEFLAFVDSDDVVLLDAYTSAISSLQETGSDFAVLGYDRLRTTLRILPGPWITEAHSRRRPRCTVEEFPEIQVNATAWTKTYRRTFWESAGLTFPEGRLYEDQPVSSRAFARATAFDVLPDVGVLWRVREDRSSISQQNAFAANLAAHTASVRDSLAEIRATGKEDVALHRVVQLLQHNMLHFARRIVEGDDAFFDELRLALRMLVEQLPRDRYLAGVDAYLKILFELVLSDRRDDATAFLESGDRNESHFPCLVTDAGPAVDRPVPGEPVDPGAHLLSDAQLVVEASVRAGHWQSPGVLRLDGWAHVSNIDLGAHDQELELVLVAPDGRRVALQVTPTTNLQAQVVGGHWHSDYRPSGFSALLRTATLPAEPRSWALEATVRVAGLVRTGPVVLDHRVAAANRQPSIERPGEAHVLRSGHGDQVVIGAITTPDHLLSHHVDDHELVVELATEGEPEVVLTPRADLTTVLATADVVSSGPGRLVARFDLDAVAALAPSGAERQTTLQLGVRHPGLPVSRVLDQVDGTSAAAAAPATLGASRGIGGGFHVVRRRLTAVITAAEPVDEELRVTIALTGVAAADLTPVLRGRNDEILGTWLDDGVVRFPLTRTVWGREGLTLPLGRYDIELRATDGSAKLPATPDRVLLDRLPVTHELSRMTTLLEVRPTTRVGLRLVIRAPVPLEHRSARGQRLLRESTAGMAADGRSVFFRTLYGEATNGNGLGVHEELVRRGSALTRYWSIRDHSVDVPDGGVGLIEQSPEWHEALARSPLHMVDVHQLSWLEKRPGQRLIQTMHGYPYKLMGEEWWERQHLPPSQVASYHRRARDWDYFVSPAGYATPLLEEAFLAPAGATPRILEIGYPRNDVLLSDRAEGIRERTRRLLGIEPGQVAVVYAPTFRDYLSADDMRAERVTFFDPAEAAAGLPDHYVFLIRGHAFNARKPGGRLGRDRSIVDVTDYPDVNDLILASDAAVLDYSSLRFDYAITDKPMVFLVPDLAAYDRARGGVIPFGPTAPGPHVDSTEEAIAHLGDLATLGAAYAEARATFRSHYVDRDDGHASARLVDAVLGD